MLGHHKNVKNALLTAANHTACLAKPHDCARPPPPPPPQAVTRLTSVQKRRFGVGHGSEHLFRPIEYGRAHALKSRGVFIAGAPLRAELRAGALELWLQAVLDHEGGEVRIPRIVLRGHAEKVISCKPEPCATSLAGFSFVRGVFER